MTSGSVTELCAYDEWSKDDEDGPMDRLTLVPENPEERGYLKCISFDLMAKGQLWVLFVKDEVFSNCKHISTIENIKTIEEYQSKTLCILKGE